MHGTTTPRVTVVVPTHDRAGYLRDLVAALQAQSCTDFAAVLVDDGSRDDTTAVFADAVGDDDRFSLVSIPNRGPAAARNTGIDRARTPWVAFTDDDCLPQPDWLAALLATADATGADVVEGRTLPDPTVDAHALPYARSQRIESWSGRFQTCNLLVRRERLQDVGGFDERFPAGGFGEDTDLGLRLVADGATTAFATRGVVHHRVIPMTARAYVARRYHWSALVRLVALNPTARQVFPHPYVAHRTHAAFWVAAATAGVAVARGHGRVVAASLAAGLAAGATRRARSGLPPGRALAREAVELTSVAVGAVGCVQASMRERRLLL